MSDNTAMAMFNPKTGLVLPDLHSSLWATAKEIGGVPIATNLPTETAEELAVIAKCDQPGALKLADMIGKTISIVGWRCKPALKEVKDGEVVELIHSVLIDAEKGIRYQSVGTGINKSLVFLTLMHGHHPWEPQIQVKVVGTQTGKGNPFLQLTEIEK